MLQLLRAMLRNFVTVLSTITVFKATLIKWRNRHVTCLRADRTAHVQSGTSQILDTNAVLRFGTPAARGSAQRSACADQTLQYGLAKATGLSGTAINNTTSAQGAG